MNSKFTSALSVMQYRIWVSHAKVSACIVTAEIYPVITVISWKTLSKVGIVYALKLLEGEAVRQLEHLELVAVHATKTFQPLVNAVYNGFRRYSGYPV